jgi:hypothetical protein
MLPAGLSIGLPIWGLKWAAQVDNPVGSNVVLIAPGLTRSCWKAKIHSNHTHTSASRGLHEATMSLIGS